MKQASLVLNGKMFRGTFRDGFMLCADGGYDMVNVKGVVPDAILGDMDSILIEPDSEITQIKYDTHKDFTDGELAMKYLIEQGYDDIFVYGAEGGRLDHVVTNLNMLTFSLKNNVKITIKCNDYDIYLTDGVFELETSIDDEISLVPFTDEVHIIQTKGLAWPLVDDILYKSGGRGISNKATASKVSVEIKKGSCFIFRLFH